MQILESKVKPAIEAKGVVGDERIAKVSLVGIGMRTHAGIASKMFGALANEGINIQMISTSDIKTSVVVDEKYMELAVRVLHRVFDLDKGTKKDEAMKRLIASTLALTASPVLAQSRPYQWLEDVNGDNRSPG
jgi:hypothetical protein